jgi:uncharacterized protein (TIGR02246 family)
MKRTGSCLILGFLICLVFSCHPREAQQTEMTATVLSDEDAIRDWYDLKTKTTNSGDFEFLRALFTEDVIFMPPGGSLFQGWEAYEAWAKPFFDANDIEENISYEEIGVFGDRAFIRTSYRMKSTPKAGGEPSESLGKAIWLFERQADGTWKGSHCIWNTNE